MTFDQEFVAAALGLPKDDEPLVPENHGPFGDYYVHPSKIRRSQELKAALSALETEPVCPACGTSTDRKPGEHFVLLDGGKRVCTNPWHNPKSFDRRKQL